MTEQSPKDRDSRATTDPDSRWPDSSRRLQYSRTRSNAGRSRRPKRDGTSKSAIAEPIPWRVVFVAWLLFTIFLTYFNVSSNHLPQGAGPDAVHNDDVSNFIYENHRLALLPDDEEALMFTRYGGTRALRPPLAFVTSAVVASLFDANDSKELRKLFRKGSALLVSVAIACAFLALWIYFQNLGVAITGALLFGLMPQVSFIASYNNDDSSAILAGTLILLSMVAVFKNGVGWKTLLLFGFSAGITIISKQSGWILFPTVVVFILIFVLRHLGKAILPAAAAAALMLLVGGWWVVFNMMHYGIDDPLLTKITQTTAEKHSRFEPDQVLGYQAQQAGFAELVLNNHDQFMTKTLHSTVGHLDWLRLKLGPSHYIFYLMLFTLGVVVWLSRLATLVLPGAPAEGRRLLFESILVLAMVVQFTAYVWINIHNDIQTQGKYLLPVLLAALIITFSGITSVSDAAGRVIRSMGQPTFRLDGNGVAGLVILLLGISTIALHYVALKSYVLPFYRPDFYSEPLKPIELGPFKRIVLSEANIDSQQNIDAIQFSDKGAITFNATSADPWFIPLTPSCAGAVDNSLVRVIVTSDIPSVFSIYWDDGSGFNESNKSTRKYKAGTTELYIWIGPRRCDRLRIDPAAHAGQYSIRNLAIATYDMAIPARR